MISALLLSSSTQCSNLIYMPQGDINKLDYILNKYDKWKMEYDKIKFLYPYMEYSLLCCTRSGPWFDLQKGKHFLFITMTIIRRDGGAETQSLDK